MAVQSRRNTIELPGFIPCDLEFREKLARHFEADLAEILTKHNGHLYTFLQNSLRKTYLKEPANILAEIKGSKLRAAGKEEQAFSPSYNAARYKTLEGRC